MLDFSEDENIQNIFYFTKLTFSLELSKKSSSLSNIKSFFSLKKNRIHIHLKFSNLFIFKSPFFIIQIENKSRKKCKCGTFFHTQNELEFKPREEKIFFSLWQKACHPDKLTILSIFPINRLHFVCVVFFPLFVCQHLFHFLFRLSEKKGVDSQFPPQKTYKQK